MNQRTLLYTLLGSIVLNAFLLGVISVHAFSRRGGLGGRSTAYGRANMDAVAEPRGQRFFRELVRAAGGPSDPRVRALWSGRRQHLGEARKALGASREQVLTALEREPFEREVLARALDEAEKARQLADHLATEGALDLAAALTSEERKTLRDAARNAPAGGRSGEQRRARDRERD